MKRPTILLGLVLLISSVNYAQEAPKVVATASIMADMAENIGGNLISVESIVPIGGDPHIYEATPRDARLVEGADLILVNGLTFEGWINELIENSGSQAPVITITDGISPIQSAVYENASDPHAWMDPILGKQYAKNILESLVELAPEFKAEFQFNYDAYISQLDDLHEYCVSRIAEIPEHQRILVTSHDAFQYFGRRYGLQLEAILGTSTDAEAQTSDIQRVSRIIEESQIPAVFIESTINPKLLQQIADDHGVVIGGQLYSDSLSDHEGPASTYIDMVKHNADTIVNALTKAKKEAPAEGSGSGLMYWTVIALVIVAVSLFLFKMMRTA